MRLFDTTTRDDNTVSGVFRRCQYLTLKYAPTLMKAQCGSAEKGSWKLEKLREVNASAGIKVPWRDEKTINKMVEMRAAGNSYNQISEVFRVTPEDVRYVCTCFGPIDPSKLTDKEKAIGREIIRLYKKGHSQTDACKAAGVSLHKGRFYFRQMGGVVDEGRQGGKGQKRKK